jgi:hypothetical protein
MARELILMISDPLLLGTVKAMLRGKYEIVSDGEDIPAVTDSNVGLNGYGCVLYIAREEKNGKKRTLLRPFTEDGLLKAVDALFDENSGEAHAELKTDARSRRVSFDGKRVTLTEKEFSLLSLLLKNKGKAVSDAEITDKIWKNEVVSGSNVCAVYVNYLRTKLENAFGVKMIYRVRGEGYMLKEIERKS